MLIFDINNSGIYITESKENVFIDNKKSIQFVSTLHKIPINEKNINKFKKKYVNLKHVRVTDESNGYMYLNNNELVALINTEKKGDNIWITVFEIFTPYKGTGLSKDIMKKAFTDLNFTHLSVNKKNEIAFKLYKDLGFKVYDETDIMYFMTLKPKKIYECFISMIEDSYELFTEATTELTYITKTELYPKIESVLSQSAGTKKFNDLVGRFIDRNSSKLGTAGPQYLIVFGDNDKSEYYKLFNIEESDIVDMIVKITKNFPGNSNFKLLRKNPIFWVFYCCIRYFTLKKDSKSLNSALAIYALSVYPSSFHKYFKYGVSSPGTMQYTIDHLTGKFLIKQKYHIFGALTYSIQQSYKFLKPGFNDMPDTEIIRFIQRIRNDQNSMLKKICNQYTINHSKGLTVSGTLDDAINDGAVVDDAQNNTSAVEFISRKVSLPTITNGIDLQRAEACAKLAQISISDTRFYLTKIITDEHLDDVQKFIEAILFVFLYEENNEQIDINSSKFLVWCSSLFRKTNSNNENIKTIKKFLDKWAEESGVHDKFKREASRISYKRAIFFYFVLSIQYYNN